jgi:tetratricopeptide (TPR) repeat protein
MKQFFFVRLTLVCIFFLIAIKLSAQTSEEKYKKYYEKARIYVGLNGDSVSFYTDRAEKLADSMNNNRYVVDVFLTRAVSEILLGKLVDANNNIDTAYRLVETNNLNDKLADVLILKGAVNRSMGLTSEALKYLLNAKDELEKNKTEDYISKEADLHFYIAYTYMDLGEIEVCQENLKVSIELAEKSGKPSAAFKAYMLLYGTYSNADTIQQLFDKANQIILQREQEASMHYEKAVLLNNQALFYETIGKAKKLSLPIFNQ